MALPRPKLRTLAAAGLAAALASREAAAQTGDARARAALRSGLSAYQNLDMDGATREARTALRQCAQRNAGCTARTQAELHILLGAVALTGRTDSAAAQTEFVSALQLDAEVAVDELINTPELATLFARARRTAQGIGELERLRHTPVTEQLASFPTPIFVETGLRGAVRVELFYRQHGATEYQHLAMERVARGWGATIPCAAVTQGSLDYYVWAYDEHDRPFAEAGSDFQPLVLAVVAERTVPAPSMPGSLPPERCRAAAERAAVGERCAVDADCAEGLVCGSNACAPRPTASAFSGARPWIAFDVGFGLGGGFPLGNAGYDEAVLPADGSSMVASCPQELSCPTGPSGPAFVYGIHLAFRVNIVQRLGLAVDARIQPDSGRRTTLAPAVLSLRAYVPVLGEGFTRNGPQFLPFLGMGVGQMQPRASAPSTERPNAATGHLVTGLTSLQLGGRFEYGFARYLHAGAEAGFYAFWPRGLVGLELTLLFGVHL